MYQPDLLPKVHVVEVGDGVATDPSHATARRVVYEGKNYKAARQVFREFRASSARGLGDDALTEVAWRFGHERVKEFVPPY